MPPDPRERQMEELAQLRQVVREVAYDGRWGGTPLEVKEKLRAALASGGRQPEGEGQQVACPYNDPNCSCLDKGAPSGRPGACGPDVDGPDIQVRRGLSDGWYVYVDGVVEDGPLRGVRDAENAARRRRESLGAGRITVVAASGFTCEHDPLWQVPPAPSHDEQAEADRPKPIDQGPSSPSTKTEGP